MTVNGTSVIDGTPASAQNMLVGQGVTVTVSPIGPAEIIKTIYDAPANNIFKDFEETATTCKVIPIPTDEFTWEKPIPATQPTTQPVDPVKPNQLHFFWGGGSGQLTLKTNVTLKLQDGTIQNPVVHKIKVEVKRPSIQFLNDTIGTVGGNIAIRGGIEYNHFGLIRDAQTHPDSLNGIEWKVKLKVPEGFGFQEGKYHFTQVINYTYRFIRPKDYPTTKYQKSTMNGNVIGLDGANPYPKNGGPYDTGLLPPGQDYPLVSDSPGFNELKGNWENKYWEMEDGFSTFLMFAPQGGKAVPLMVENWWVKGKFYISNLGGWEIDKNFSKADTSKMQITTTFPKWDRIISGGEFVDAN